MRCALKLSNTTAAIIRDNTRVNSSLTDKAISAVYSRFSGVRLWSSDYKSLVVEGLVTHDVRF